MIATVNSQVLAAELRLINRIVPSKPAIQILSHVLLKADDGLGFYATDLEIGLATSCGAQVALPGKVVASAAKLLALVEQCPDADVHLALEKGGIVVKCGAFRSVLQTMPVEDFPVPPSPDGTSWSLDGEGLRHLIRCTRYAINTVATKFVLQGALLTLNGTTAAMVATDGKRLALITMVRSGSDLQAVVPVKALDMLSTLTGPQVELIVGKRHLFFVAGKTLLISRMLEGQFPAYERIIPRSNMYFITVDKGALASALRRVNLLSEETQAVYFNLEPSTLNLSSFSAGIGNAAERVPVNYDGPIFKICINGTHVLDFLNAAADSSIMLSLKDANSPLLLTDGQQHLGVIMTMRA